MGVNKFRVGFIPVIILLQFVILCTGSPTSTAKPTTTTPASILLGTISGELYLTHDNKMELRIPRGDLLPGLNATFPTEAPGPMVTHPASTFHYNPYYFGWVVALMIGANLIIMVAVILTCLKKFKKGNTYCPGAKPLTEDDAKQI